MSCVLLVLSFGVLLLCLVPGCTTGDGGEFFNGVVTSPTPSPTATPTASPTTTPTTTPTPGVPSVTNVTPADNAADVEPDGVVTVTFSEDMDPATINNTNLYLTGPSGNVPGAVTYDAGTRTATFTPAGRSPFLSQYTVTVTTGAASTDAVAMAADFTSTFTVRAGAWQGAVSVGTTSDAVYPQVAMDASGNAVAVWQEISPDRIYASRYDFAADTWDTPLRIDTAGGEIPRVACDPNGNAIAVWQYSNDVFARPYDAATDTWGTITTLDASANNAGSPEIATDPAGNGVAVWHEYNGARYAIYARRYDAGTDTWSGATMIDWGTGEAENPDVSMDSSGNAIAVWVQNPTDHYSAYVNHYDAGTNSWSGATQIGFYGSPIFRSYDPKISVSSNGDAIATWYADGTHQFVFANCYDASTTSWGTEQDIDSGSNNAQWPDVAVDGSGNGFVVWYQSDGSYQKLYSNRYDKALDNWGGATLVESLSYNSYTPDVACTPDGKVCAVWGAYVSSHDVFSNWYDPTGGTWGTTPDLLETEAGYNDVSPRVAVSPDGCAVVVWTHGTMEGMVRANVYR